MIVVLGHPGNGVWEDYNFMSRMFRLLDSDTGFGFALSHPPFRLSVCLSVPVLTVFKHSVTSILKLWTHRASSGSIRLDPIGIHCDAWKSVPDPFPSLTMYIMYSIWCCRWCLMLGVSIPLIVLKSWKDFLIWCQILNVYGGNDWSISTFNLNLIVTIIMSIATPHFVE